MEISKLCKTRTNKFIEQEMRYDKPWRNMIRKLKAEVNEERRA